MNTKLQQEHPSEIPLYRDTTRSVDERCRDLLGRMSVVEKVAQLRNISCPGCGLTEKEDGKPIITQKMKSILCGHGVGSLQGLVRSDPWSRKDLVSGFNRREGAEIVNEVQRMAIEHSRWGIPLLIMDDSRHGQQGIGTTIFPCGITLGCTWNPALLRRIGNVVATELRSQGQTVSIGPNLNLARDPRWSRMEETYGEDPCLAGKLGSAYVTGCQNETPEGCVRAVAGIIMFGPMGDVENGQDARGVHLGRRDLKEMILRPFESAVKAGALGAMASYSEVDGVPCHANKELLTDILRDEWGFRGFIESDANGLLNLKISHCVAEDLPQAAALGIRAGLDIDLYIESCEVYFDSLITALDQNMVSIDDIDRSVYRILRVKFMLGLFENPYADPEQAVKSGRPREHVEIALEAARESIVLLKNEKNILPLDRTIKSIAVIGPNADDPGNQLGDYTPPIAREEVVTILDGIKKYAPQGTQIRYARGCGIKDPSTSGFEEAIKAAKESDVTIVVIGGSSKREYEQSFNSVGTGVIDQAMTIADIECGEGYDRATLDLLGSQRQLVEKIKETGTRVIVVMIHGRPISIPEVAQIADAIVDAWYPGEQGGSAVAEVLFGKYNPAGRLCISIPRHVGQLPMYYNNRRPGRNKYVEMDAQPLFPFGYGLSYTTFEYTNLKITQDKIPADGSTTVTVNVTNTGKIAGDEVVQMYIRDEYSSVVRPSIELKGFQRIHLAPGKKQTVPFTIGYDELRFCGPDMNWIVEPGDFIITIGGIATPALSASLRVFRNK